MTSILLRITKRAAIGTAAVVGGVATYMGWRDIYRTHTTVYTAIPLVPRQNASAEARAVDRPAVNDVHVRAGYGGGAALFEYTDTERREDLEDEFAVAFLYKRCAEDCLLVKTHTYPPGTSLAELYRELMSGLEERDSPPQLMERATRPFLARTHYVVAREDIEQLAAGGEDKRTARHHLRACTVLQENAPVARFL